MPKSITEVLMNPVRMRIAQYLMLHKPATTQEISSHLTDVPKASLYRHLSRMTTCGLLKVVSENRIRGTVEKVYALSDTISDNDAGSDNEKLKAELHSMLLLLLGEFERYLSRENADPVRDMLSARTATLLLSDEEFIQFSKELFQVYARALDNKPDGKRKMRRITTIVSPVTDQKA